MCKLPTGRQGKENRDKNKTKQNKTTTTNTTQREQTQNKGSIIELHSGEKKPSRFQFLSNF